MLHTFQNDDGERIAADTAEQAGHYHDIELGSNKEIIGKWTQIPDDASLTIGEDGDPKSFETKTAREWAEEHETPGYVSTTYT